MKEETILTVSNYKFIVIRNNKMFIFLNIC